MKINDAILISSFSILNLIAMLTIDIDPISIFAGAMVLFVISLSIENDERR